MGMGGQKAFSAQCIASSLFLTCYRLLGGDQRPLASVGLWPLLALLLCPLMILQGPPHTGH